MCCTTQHKNWALLHFMKMTLLEEIALEQFSVPFGCPVKNTAVQFLFIEVNRTQKYVLSK